MAVDTAQTCDNLKHCAKNIKAAQLAEKRKRFDQLPSFLQAGLFLCEKYENVRRQDFVPRLLAFEMVKSHGNDLFAEKRYEEAARQYEEVSLFFDGLGAEHFPLHQERVESVARGRSG
jgi:hypothetical protein